MLSLGGASKVWWLARLIIDSGKPCIGKDTFIINSYIQMRLEFSFKRDSLLSAVDKDGSVGRIATESVTKIGFLRCM